MIEPLDSNYDCAMAGDDLHQLLQQLESYSSNQVLSQEDVEQKNRLENQIRFIRNKCHLDGGRENP